MVEMIVTTADLKCNYEIIGPVYYQISNKGVFSSVLSQKKEEYALEIEKWRREGQASDKKTDWGFLYDFSVGQNEFDNAFYIAVQELKIRAKRIGGDAIIGMRQDIDIDSNGLAFFYLQMYGTAVKIKKTRAELEKEKIEKELEEKEKALKEKEEQEKQSLELEKQRIRIRELKESIKSGDDRILQFIAAIEGENRFLNIADEWESKGLKGEPMYSDIEKTIYSKAQVERMYGSKHDSNGASNFIKDIKSRFTD